MSSEHTIVSTKGTVTVGSLREAAKWIHEHQPSHVSVDTADIDYDSDYTVDHIEQTIRLAMEGPGEEEDDTWTLRDGESGVCETFRGDLDCARARAREWAREGDYSEAPTAQVRVAVQILTGEGEANTREEIRRRHVETVHVTVER